MVAGVGGGAVPLAPSLAVLAGTMLVMDTGLGVVIVCGNTLCTWSNLCVPFRPVAAKRKLHLLPTPCAFDHMGPCPVSVQQ